MVIRNSNSRALYYTFNGKTRDDDTADPDGSQSGDVRLAAVVTVGQRSGDGQKSIPCQGHQVKYRADASKDLKHSPNSAKDDKPVLTKPIVVKQDHKPARRRNEANKEIRHREAHDEKVTTRAQLAVLHEWADNQGVEKDHQGGHDGMHGCPGDQCRHFRVGAISSTGGGVGGSVVGRFHFTWGGTPR